MKYLEKYNESKNYKFTIVTFEMGEYVKALYIDGVLEFYGDYYHNKISEKISAFIEGVEWSGLKNIDVENLNCVNNDINEEVCEMGGMPPKYLKDL